MQASLSFIPAILLFPLLGVIVNAFWGKYLGDRGAGVFASLMAGLSFTVAVIALVVLAGRGFQGEEVVLYPWITAGPLQVNMAFLVDTLSTTMMLVVTGVGTLIH